MHCELSVTGPSPSDGGEVGGGRGGRRGNGMGGGGGGSWVGEGGWWWRGMGGGGAACDRVSLSTWIHPANTKASASSQGPPRAAAL